MTRDTGPARLPALPAVRSDDPALKRWIDAVAERLEVREGSRGNAAEKSVTKRELDAVQSAVNALSYLTEPKTATAGQTIIDLGPGLRAVVPVTQFATAILQTDLYRDLNRRIDDPERFNWLSSELRSLVTRSIAAEAALRGADIRRAEVRIEDVNRSVAAQITEITSALGSNAAGIRQVEATYVSTATAQATQITQLEVSLGNYYQDGTAGRASLEQTLGVGANPTSGLLAQYTLKVSAGGALAGFGIAASEVNGTPSSAFIIQADKFAVVSTTYTGGLTTTPTVANVPFGVDASGIHLNSSAVYIKTDTKVGSNTGPTLSQGLRGSLNVSAVGTAWSDTTARQAIWTALGNAASPSNNNHLVIGDTVTIANSTTPPTFVQTRYWSGSTWVSLGVVIDGNLLVSGTISADKIGANQITAAKINGQNLVIFGGSHSATYGWPASGGGFHLSSSGLLLGNFNTGSYFQVSAAGAVTAPGFSISGGSATFSGTLSGAIVNTAQIVGGAASSAFSATSTAGVATVNLSVTVPTGASAVLISYYLGPTYVDNSGGKYGGTVTGPVLTDLSIVGVGNTGAIIIGPGAGTYTLTCTRASFDPTSTMRLSALVLKR